MKKSNELRQIEKLAGGNEETKQEFLRIFIRQTTNQINQLKTSLIKEDWNEIKQIVHTMRSSFVYIGMSDAMNLAKTIEETINLNHEATTIHVFKLCDMCLKTINMLTIENKNKLL